MSCTDKVLKEEIKTVRTISYCISHSLTVRKCHRHKLELEKFLSGGIFIELTKMGFTRQ